MSEPFQHSFRRSDTPRRVADGIRLRRRAGLDGLPWPASAWFAAATRGAGAEALREGHAYAVSGQVAGVALLPGACEGRVQGRAPRPYTVAIRCTPLEREGWGRVIAAMAGEAIYAARLLAGELPTSADSLFDSLGLPLMPGDSDPSPTCTCSEGGRCKHVVALAAVVAERIEQDPLLLFTLRGMPGERLLERLQEARALATRGHAQAHPAPPAANAPCDLPPIEQCLHDFWRPGSALQEFERMPSEPHAPHALLKRLGPPPLGGKFPMLGLLASAYDTVRAAALRIEEAPVATPPED